MCPVVRNRSLKIAKIDQHDGIAAGFEITAAILEIVSKSQKQARYGTEKNVSQMCGTKMNTHVKQNRFVGGENWARKHVPTKLKVRKRLILHACRCSCRRGWRGEHEGANMRGRGVRTERTDSQQQNRSSRITRRLPLTGHRRATKVLLRRPTRSARRPSRRARRVPDVPPRAVPV